MRFLNPGFLFFLPLALLPVIIHLFSRFRLRRVLFPSLILVQTVRRERLSWLRLREIVLLILRTLALLFLLFALARPYLPRALPGLKAEDLVIILDDSYSMSYGNRWREALTATRQFIRAATRPRLILTSQPETIFSGKNFLLTLLDTLPPSNLARPLTSELNHALTATGTGYPSFVVITDLQRSALPATGINPPPAPLLIVNLGSAQFVNAGISRIYLDNGQLTASIVNHSPQPLTRTVRLHTDKKIEEQLVNIPTRSMVTVRFATRIDQPGTYIGWVEITADSLPSDDIRYFAFNIPATLPVLIVTTPAAFERYLTLALTADAARRFTPTVIDISELRRVDLRRYPLLIIADAAALKPEDWERISFYRSSGGAALVIAGTPLPGNSGIDPDLKILGFNRPSGFLAVATMDTTHPIFNIFRLPDFSSSRFFSTTRLVGGKQLLKLTNGDPLITELPERHLIVWTFTPTPEGTDLVFKAPFAPLLLRSLLYLTAQLRPAEYTVGDTIALPVKSTVPLMLSTPKGNVLITPQPGPPHPRIFLTDTRTPGIYQIDSLAIAVNISAEEGNLTPFSVNALAQAGIKIQTRAIPTADLIGFLLLLALGAFFLEMVVLSLERFFQKSSPVRR
ncbi:MAG: BatA domain-containing protein [bacterium]